MMQRRTAVMFVLYGVSLCAADVTPIKIDQDIKSIEDMRARQHVAGIQEYYDYEKKINDIKHAYGNNDVRSEGFLLRTLRDGLHAVPFLVWQLSCIFLLFFVLFKKRVSWIALGLLLIISGMLVLGYYERKQKWLVIKSNEVPLRLGPGASYPVQKKLHILDEVRVLSLRDGWSQIESQGVIGWIDDACC